MAHVMVTTVWVWACPECDAMPKHHDREALLFHCHRHIGASHAYMAGRPDPEPVRKIWVFNVVPADRLPPRTAAAPVFDGGHVH